MKGSEGGWRGMGVWHYAHLTRTRSIYHKTTQRFIIKRSESQERSDKRKMESNKEAEGNHGERAGEEKEDETSISRR